MHVPFYMSTHASECLQPISTRDTDTTWWLQLTGVHRGILVYPQQAALLTQCFAADLHTLSAQRQQQDGPRVPEAISS